jgi:hypothetical protein
MTAAEESKRIACDPVALAEWVSKYALSISHEDDIGLCVPKEKMELWGISERERQADANEIKILRALGAVSFISTFETYEFCKTFKRQIAAYTARRISQAFIESLIDEIERTFDEYLRELDKDSPIGFYLTYLNRVFPGNEVQRALLESRIPGARFEIYWESNRLVCEGYTQLRYGMSYDTFMALTELEKKV